MQLLFQANPQKAEPQKSMVAECPSVQLSVHFSRQENSSFLEEGFCAVCNNETFFCYNLVQIVAVTQIATIRLICEALSKSIQRQTGIRVHRA